MITTPHTAGDIINLAVEQSGMSRSEFDYSLASGNGKAQAWIFQTIHGIALRNVSRYTPNNGLIDERLVSQQTSNIFSEIYPHITRLVGEARAKRYVIRRKKGEVRVQYEFSY